MKQFILLLVACVSPLFAQLPQMSEEMKWLGYFSAWENKDFEFGIGADGELVLFAKENGKRRKNTKIGVRYLFQEEMNGKWINRTLINERGLHSANEKGVNSKGPITVVMAYKGGSKIEWVHVLARKNMVMMPKLLTKETKNNIRVGLMFSLPSLYSSKKKLEGRALRKITGSDYLQGTRLSDGEKIRMKFSGLENDVTSDKFFKDGVSAVEVSAQIFSLVVKNAVENSGRIDIVPKGALYKSFKIRWLANMEKLGGKDTYVTFAVE